MSLFSSLSPIFHFFKEYNLKLELTCSFSYTFISFIYLVNGLLCNEWSSLRFSEYALKIINVLGLFLLGNTWYDHMHMLKEVTCNLKAFSPSFDWWTIFEECSLSRSLSSLLLEIPVSNQCNFLCVMASRTGDTLVFDSRGHLCELYSYPWQQWSCQMCYF